LNKKLQLEKDSAWITDVRKITSPNQDDRPGGTDIELLVIHGISLPPGEYGGPYIDQLFTNKLNADDHPYFAEIIDLRVSAHILINRLGEITQYVAFNKRAWHAGESEFQGRPCCNDYSIGVELEGNDEQSYTQEQYQILVELTGLIKLRWPEITNDYIVGHCHISPDRKTDPGAAFDWDYFFDLLDKKY
jgi:AmpD protein